MGNSKQTLAALLVATAGEDRRAFAEFYARTSSRVYGMVCDVTAGSKHRDSLVQDIFVRAWERAGQYDPTIEDPMTWVMTLAHRHAVDQARKEATFPPTRAASGPSATSADNGPIGSIHPDERESLMMAYGAGMTYQKIAETLGVTERTVKGRIRDGARNLNNNRSGRSPGQS